MASLLLFVAHLVNCSIGLLGRQFWQDTPEGTKSQYRSALKTWLEYCDLLRRMDSTATNAPWPDTKVSLTLHST
jgi:hypothetical protein